MRWMFGHATHLTILGAAILDTRHPIAMVGFILVTFTMTLMFNIGIGCLVAGMIDTLW
jgi:hypothetical protein